MSNPDSNPDSNSASNPASNPASNSASEAMDKMSVVPRGWVLLAAAVFPRERVVQSASPQWQFVAAMNFDVRLGHCRLSVLTVQADGPWVCLIPQGSVTRLRRFALPRSEEVAATLGPGGSFGARRLLRGAESRS